MKDEGGRFILNFKKTKLINDIVGLRSEAKAAINGVLGDKLHRKNSPYAIKMGFLSSSSSDAHELDLQLDTAPQLASKPSSSITIFVHSLMSSERLWSLPRRLKDLQKSQSYGQRLQLDCGTSAIYLRYNTGLHISTNAQQLVVLIDELIKSWPVEVTEINLIGHSMGGLVVRSAVHYGHKNGALFSTHLKRVYLLGAPLRGAPLEKFANVLTSALATIPTPVTRIVAHGLNQRSEGIKDLRHGYLIDEEWQDQPADIISYGRTNNLLPIQGIQYFSIAGNLFSDEHHLAAKIFGDLLVPPFSAKDEGLDGTATDRAADKSVVFAGVNHIGLANDEKVYQQIRTWWQA